MGGRWTLPSGNPGVIYLDASGNDIYIHEDETKAREHVTLTRLRSLSSCDVCTRRRIVFGGVVYG